MGVIFGEVLQWFGTLLQGLLAFVGLSLAKRFTLGATAVAASIALYIGLSSTIHALLSGIFQSLPGWASHIGLFMPANIGACISAVVAAKFAFAFYQWNLTNLKIISLIN